MLYQLLFVFLFVSSRTYPRTLFYQSYCLLINPSRYILSVDSALSTCTSLGIYTYIKESSCKFVLIACAQNHYLNFPAQLSARSHWSEKES